MTELEKMERAAEQLRELIREAHGATKDLRAAAKEAKEAYHELTREALEEEWAAAQAELTRAFQAANDRGVREIDKRLARMVKYLVEHGVLPKGAPLLERHERTGFMFFANSNDGTPPTPDSEKL